MSKQTELEILKAELQLNKDRLNVLESEREQIIEVLGLEVIEDEDEKKESDFSYLDNEDVFLWMSQPVKDEIKAELEREGKGRSVEQLTYDLLKVWCNCRNIDIEKFKK